MSIMEGTLEKPPADKTMNHPPIERFSTEPPEAIEKSSSSLIGRLKNSELFRSYREIFENSTGLPLVLRSVASNQASDETSGNRFCRMLNGGAEKCPQCVETHDCLSSPENRGVKSVRCFANMVETVVPVIQAGQVVARLATGHVLHEKPTKEHFVKAMEGRQEGADRNSELEQAYLESPVVGEERYRAMVTLLAAFSLQLGELAGQIIQELRHEKSDAIACAKDFIEENIHDQIILEEVASEIHMSRYYLCRRFKESTGMTLTEYVAIRRVDMAKEMLESTSLRVADIAFEVGFQSLSQFNRSFHKATRVTPTEFRRSANANSSRPVADGNRQVVAGNRRGVFAGNVV